METKKIIIIGVLLIIISILAGALYGILSQNTQYERIEIVPNGTSIEIPTDNATYTGEINETGAKLWTFKQGTLTTYNSAEASTARGLYSLGGAFGIKEIKDMVLNHFEKKETIDGYTIYTLDGETMDIPGRDKIYVIETGNDTTHDNIIITTDNKDITLHMAKSIQYKEPNITNTINETNTNSTLSSNTIKNTTDENISDELPVSYYSQHPEEEESEDYEDNYYETYYEDIESDSSAGSYESSSSASANGGSSSASG